ncbi:P-loop containing nucleoside triphosphate hydrolase [Phytophthora cactorum]|nr:P-loop containing nucleoside triphosphate hydrolase [Phytophthora cactorum]
MADVDGHEARREAAAATANDSSSEAQEQHLVSVGRLHAGLQQLLAAVSATNYDALQTHPALQVLATSFPTVGEHDHHSAARTQLQALASCLAHAELRVLIVKHLRPFLLDLMVRLTDPALPLYEQQQQQYSECIDSMKRTVLRNSAVFLRVRRRRGHAEAAERRDARQTAPHRQDGLPAAESETHRAHGTLELDAVLPAQFPRRRARAWYAARATALVLKMGNAQRNAFLDGLSVGEDAAVSGNSPAARQIELELHSEDATRQEQLIELSVYQQQGENEVAETQPVPFHDSLQNIFGVVVPTSKLHQQRHVSEESSMTTEPLVPTPSTKRNLQSLAIALGLKRPILVAGPGGCGKTATIRELARLSGNGDMVELHLDDQIDSKTLLGSYVCTDVPGEFTWQPGALTTAVLAGRWVVIEDIDRASFEVLAALMPLLETREMVLPGRGELLVAHSNFQIFGTTTHGHQMPKGFQESVWTSVGVAPLADSEIEQIMLTRFTKIPQQVVAKIMTTYNAVSGNTSEDIGGPAQLWKETRRNYGRDFCLRDLLKWCKRIYRFCYYAAGSTSGISSSGHDYITEDERMRIVVEALDVFCAGIRDAKTRLHSACALAAIWEVQSEKIEYYLEQHKPHVTFNTREVEFGRVHLPTLSQQAQLEQGDKPATSSVHMAAAMGQRLVVQNLNIQSDSSDLVGGFKPVEIHLLTRPLYMDFVDLFTATFSQKSNAGFLNVVRIALEHKDWKKLVKGMRKAIQMATSKLQGNSGADRDVTESESGGSNKMATAGTSTSVLVNRWDTFEAELVRFERQKEQAESHFAFSFVEGVLVKALREGHWVLLDEINLASSDTLERISTLLEHETSAFSLTERGDVEIIHPHPNFRLFGAMNPSTDVGKKDLPPSLRNRFTEIYVDECVDPSDLQMVVHHQFKEISGALVPETVEFYLEARKQAELRLSDGARHKPRYSLPRDGIASISRETHQEHIRKDDKAKELKRSPPCPGGSKKTNEFVLVSSYWVKKGDFQDPRDDSLPDPVTSRRKFVLTKSVEENLRHVSRAALIGKYPVLLQGPTSAGYLGSYVSDSNGKLTFKEGVLVEAVRKGWWIILDELNLAPSEVLEALNRLLDDNRELFLPETQETVKPHPKFMLFATQNPPGLYGGRKVLSRAFRNRFLEVQVDEVASSELQTILQERSSLPPSYCGILIDVMRQLQLVRQQSSVFAGKSGFITTRDLLRWAERRPATKQALAEEGYCLLAERLRKDEEKEVVKQVLEKKCNVKIDLDALYYSGKPRESNLLNENGEVEQETVWGTKEQFERVQAMVEQAVEEAATGKTSNGEPKSAGNAAGLEKISVTKSLRRLFALVGRCLQNEEPVLLVGETGCGKTTHTETSDFLGCLRPVRGKEKTAHDLEEALVSFFAMGDGCIDEQEIEQRRAEAKSLGVSAMLTKYESVRGSVVNDDSAPQKELAEQIDALKRRFQSIFEWADGPLVESMKNGDLILIDEVNLAEDAVLERLNSVLEPSRTLLLAEKGGDQVEEIVAHSKWRVMATMNPGGDFGKRELSPALRNRFTEIWVPAISDLDDIATIIRDRLVGPCGIVPPPRVIPSAASGDLASLCDPILSFVKTFNEANEAGGGLVGESSSVDGVCARCSLVNLDGLGLGSDKALHTALKAREEAYRYLLAQVPDEDHLVKQKVIDSLNVTTLSVENSIDQLNSFASEEAAEGKFGVSRPIILEGSPGVGKTSLISALAAASGHRLVRINLSEQTDISDLFGSDLPAASSPDESADANDGNKTKGGSSSGMFEWCDGVFLRALKAGDWVLLDELNLASQSVLEGLNSCLDHRGSVYIPELDREFECPPTFRLELLCDFIYVERMRSARDRELISRRFEEFFGVRPMDLSAVSLRMSADFVEIGSALLERRQDMPLGRVAPPVFNFLLKPMEALVHCVNMSWPALLVGPPASGKTSSVRLLAALSGNTLHELGMSAGTDATELLGCFEQVDVGRKLRDIKHKIQIVHAKVLQQLMLSSASVGITQKKRTAILKKANRLSSTWWALTTREKYYSDNASHGGSGKKHKAKTLPKGQLDEVVVDLMRDVVALLQKTEKGETLSLLSDLSNEIDNVVKLSKSNSIASYFEWVDGTLIQAMEKGEWVLLDNVNFCSSSVLDRLNALMETGGEMLINECGIINGKLRVIKPHKNFRMFLAMDSQYGEVSRAMRNRCVEIALADEDAPRLDLIKISLACGIPGFALSRAFQCAHERVVNKLGEFMAASKYGRINRRHLENWSLLASAELSRGVQPMNAIAESFQRVYGDGLLAQLDLSQDVLELFLSAFQTSQQNLQGQRVLPMIAAPSTFVLCQQSENVREQDADDLQLSWLTLNVTVVKYESPTEGDSNPDAWLNSVALRCKGEETSYPQTALKEACDHLSSKQFFGLENVNTPLAVTLAPFALRRLLRWRSMTKNELYVGSSRKIDEAAQRLTSLLGGPAGLPPTPVYLAANHAAFLRLQALVAECSANTPAKKVELDSAWDSMLIAQRQLELLDGVEWLRFCEQEQYREVDALFASSTKQKRNKRDSRRLDKLSVLQQSYAVHKYHADRSNVDNELTFLVHPLLNTFDVFLSAFVGDFSIARQVFEWTHFLIHWQWLKKSLLRLAKLIEQHSFVWESHWNNLVDMSERMQGTIEKLIGCESRKNVLWKKGGHSLLPSNADLWKAEYLLNRLSRTFMQVSSTSFSALSIGASGGPTDGRVDVLALLFGGVASMEAAMKSGKLDVSSLFYVDVDTRKEVLHALCAFSYLAQEQTRGKTGSASTSKRPHALMAEELFKLPNLLSEEDSRIGKDAPILLFDMKESALLMERMVTFQLSPLLEHALARQELQAITKLVHVLNMYRLCKSDLSQTRYSEIVAAVSDVLKLLEGIIEELLRLGLRDPACFYAYQDIVWCGHKFVSLEISSKTQDEQVAELEKFASVVQTHLNGVLFGFHQFLRCNSFNQVDLISLEIFDTRRKLRKANKRLPAVSTEVADHSQVVAGYPRLFQAVQSAVVLKSIAEVDLEESMCPTSEAQMRAARLEKIKTHFATEQTQAGKMMSSTSISFVRELFVATVLAFESTFQTDSASAQWEETQSLLLEFADTSQSFDGKTQATLLKALRTSSDSTFSTLVDALVAPLMTSLATAAKESNNGRRGSLGESMVMLGLWRFALLLPSSPVDPVTKPLVKKENLLNGLAMLTMQDAANSSINRLNPSPLSSVAAVENADRSLSELYGQVVEVSAHAIQRYQPSKRHTGGDAIDPSEFGMQPVAASVFGELFRDLLRFNTTVMPAEKLSALLSTVRSSKSSQQRKRELLRELDMFQQTSESFVAQLSKKFGERRRFCLVLAYQTSARLRWLCWTWRWRRWSFFSGDIDDVPRNRVLDSTAVDTALESSKTLFDLFLAKWQEQKEREEQKRKEEEELFKYKVRQLDLETEEELLEQEYRDQFPDYSTRDFQAFLSPEQASAADTEGAGLSATGDLDMLITDRIMQRLCETHVKLYAETANSEIAITKNEIVSTFARAFSLAVKLRKSLNATASTSIESAVASSGVLAASLVQARLGSSVGTKKGAVPSFQALSSDYIRGVDFHRDPLVKEVVLVAEPLQRLLVKVQSLLAQWPDHAILQQIVLIADRIRNFEISSPLVRTLTGVELLLRKAQEWEMYAARAYSISDELGALSALVTRWRKLELYSWPHLLYVKEKQHRFTAQKTWINMYSLLTAQFESDTAMVDIDELNSANPQNLQWLHLNHLSKWLFTPLHENRAGIQALSEAARESLEKQREFMTRLFETLDAYIRSCPIGQYETRLLVVYSFCAQLFMELWSASERQGSSIDFAGKSSKYALANMLYHLYRYYAQHLGYLERQWSGLKAPIQRKLVEFVKICRWDEQTYYSLAESAEKSHRKLMKFVRDYDAVLTVSMQTVIDGSTDSGITKEGGFVGIHTTKAELAGLDDSVVVPKDVEHDEEKSEQDTSADGEAAEGVKTNSKKESKEEEAQESERPPVLRLIHTSAPSVVSHASEDTAMLEQSSYVGKLPALSKRIAKYTQKHILSHDQVERRQQVRELCEELCETIFYRMFKLQKATGLPKGAKKKALIDLLSELKTQGLAYHRLQLPAEQQQIQQLLPTVRGLKGKKKQGKKKSKRVGGVQQVEVTEEASTKNSPMWLWQRADGYYYRFLGQLASLRYSAVTSFSHDLSSSETERMSGYAENMLFTMLQQRQILHATSLSHEKLVDGLTTLKLMKEFKKNYLASSKAVVDPKTASKWQSFQQASVVSLRHSLRELEISVLQILEQLPETTMIVAEVRQHFQRIFERCDAIQDSLTQGAGLTQSLGVPAIPHRAVNASEDAGGDAAIVAFARPSKRVYGVSPVVSRADGSEAQKLPVAVDVLKTNTARFGDIQGLLLSISSAFGTVTTSSCLEDFLTEFACIVRDDGKFEQTLNETSDDFASSADQKVDEHESAQALAVFSEQYDKMVETVLVSIQDLTKISKGAASVSTPSEEDETSEAQSLRDQLAMLSTMVKDSRVNHIASQLAKLLELLQTQYTKVASTRSEEWQRVFVASLSLLERFEPSLVDVRGISRQLLVDFLVAHKSVMKLDFVLIRIFRNLFQHGFCRTDEEKNGEEGEGNAGKMQFQDDVEGTGMGEGEGKKDVSNEIEDEEQLLGLQGDQQEEPEPPEDQKPEDTGLEMQNDFEGTMQDVPDDEKEDQDENEDDEEELDREMGEFDQDDENVVDEKMWGEDSDDDEDNIDKEKEKFEEDSKVEGEALEDEVRGKDGDEEDKEDKSDKKEEDKQKPQLDQSDDKNAEDVRRPSRRGPDGAGGGHGEDEAEEEHGDELPEDMQLDKDGDDGEDDGDADGDNPDEDMDNLDDPEDEMDDANGDETGGADEDENAEEENEEEQLDNAVQLGGGGLEDEPEQAEEKEEEDAEQTEAPESTEEEQAASTVAGTQSKDGQDELEADEQEAEDQEMEDANAQEQDQEQSNDDSSSSRAQKQSSSNDQDAKQEWKPQSQVDSNPDQERPREKRRDRREPNPYRNAQEAQEHWKKRVEMVDRTEEEKEADNNSSDKQEKAAEMTTAERRGENVEKKEEDETNAGNGATAMEVDEEEEKTEQSTKDKEQDKPKPVKQEPKPDSDAAEDNAEKQEDQKMNEQDAKPENPTQSGEHELLDEEAEHALPSRLRDLDLTNSMQDQDEGDEAEARAVKLLSPDEVAALRDELDSFIASWSSQSEQERGADLWAKYTALTAGASQRLCEQLRLVLEPMLRAKLEGDFRTGKRINMRKVIPYIASQFRKDKIWLRRTRPSKRQYQVMLAIDDSESMADNHAGRLALEALATLCKGMTQLEVGELSVVKFGQDLELLHAFDTPFTDDAGSRLIGRFGFQQKKTNMVQTLDTILQLLETAKQSSAASSSTVEFTQIVFLISDGRFDSDGRVRIRKLIETALERQQLIVLLIVDQERDVREGQGAHGAVSGELPVPVLRAATDVAMLPEILSDSLRQWFEMLQAKS